MLESKGRDKDHSRTGHEGQEGEYRYSSTLSLTSALDGVGGQLHVPASLVPGRPGIISPVHSTTPSSQVNRASGVTL